MSGKSWLESSLKITKFSALGAEVAELLDLWQRGIYHLPHRQLGKTDWSSEHFIQYNFRGSLSSYDFSKLTELVVLGHDLMIRIELGAINFGVIRLMFHKRTTRDPAVPSPKRMPTLESHVLSIRQQFGLPVPEIQQAAPAKVEPMSLEQAVEILNDHKFETSHMRDLAPGSFDPWQADPAQQIAWCRHPGLTGGQQLTERDAIHRARQLVRRSARKAAKAGANG